jgi:hypothetical protein
MILLHSLAAATTLLVSAVLLAGAGNRVLRWLKVEFPSPLESPLFALALGAVFLELAATGGELFPSVRYGIIVAASITAALGLTGTSAVLRDLASLRKKFRTLPNVERLLAAILFVVLGLQGLAALAPITGSDALHYHFTSQALILQMGFHPNWSLLHAFFAGLGHQLILTGLALGSDRLATGLLYLGGLAATLATLCLARQFIGGAWSFATALAFTLTPVTFWQVSTAGAPDVWMCAFLPLDILAILFAARSQSIGACVLAGILAGATAGTKYTGILMAGALLVAFAIEIRSFRKCLIFFGPAVAVGVWPYLRNFVWTGDALFPYFFVRRQHPSGNVNALLSILKDTGASNAHGFFRVIRFPFFAVTDYGFATWQFLGPLILTFGPVALLSVRKTPLWRAVLVVWLIVSLGVGKTSGIPRFLLPVLPLALAASIGGIALLTRERFRLLRGVTILSLAGFVLAGFAAMVVYSQAAWSVALGQVSPDSYLSAYAPDYERSRFVNTQIARLSTGGPTANTMVFFHHLYYVRAPFLSGDPEDSWLMDPALLSNDQAWLGLFARENIRWVVKTDDYPIELAESLTRLQNEGILRPCASGTVQSLQGFRIDQNRVLEPITIFCVQP